MAKNNSISNDKPVVSAEKPVEIVPETSEKPVETPATPLVMPTPIPNPVDEFPINVEVFCRIKRHNQLQAAVFLKAMHVENRFKKLYIKEWEQKFEEFYGRKV
jgi:hypothetical protein